MAKKIILRAIKVFLFTGYIILWIVALVIFYTFDITEGGSSSLMYWLILAGLLGAIKLLHIKSKIIFALSILLFALGAILASLGFLASAETIMRMSFLGWMVGLAQVLVGLVKEKHGQEN